MAKYSVVFLTDRGTVPFFGKNITYGASRGVMYRFLAEVCLMGATTGVKYRFLAQIFLTDGGFERGVPLQYQV